jgi:ferrous iron transport protein B
MKKITIALAGNANVGKSVIFNYLTGLHQHIGNWPGKTVEKAEGTLIHENYEIDIIDLPGIYSLSTFSMEELITRNYISKENPDVVINVVDSTNLERNLYFTIQLLELGRPVIIALNQMDLAEKKGLCIDYKKLEKILGVPVIPTIAIQGKGIHNLVHEAIKIVEMKHRRFRKIVHKLIHKTADLPIRQKRFLEKIKFGKEIEKEITKIIKILGKTDYGYPKRFVAIKLFENDEEIIKIVKSKNPKILKKVEKSIKKLEKLHGHDITTIIASERYNIVNSIIKKFVSIGVCKFTYSDKLHEMTTHGIFGYIIMISLVFSLFYFIFQFGNLFSEILIERSLSLTPFLEQQLGKGLTKELIIATIEGLVAGITIVLPYILPFYIILGLLEDSGYLSRIAFLMDKFMHKIGLHGKAFIPLMLGYGCNVPACLGCRIMETKRERLIAIFVTTLIPCAAVTTIILGLVGKYVGIEWVISLYLINVLIIFVLGRFAYKTLPGEPTGLIMEMNDYRIPHVKTVLKQSWFRIKEFIFIAMPLIIVSSLIIKILDITGIVNIIENLMLPITVDWLGLPPFTSIALFFGILRKELTLIILASNAGTSNFSEILTPIQMIVFSLVTMLYIPCIATIAALIKEIGWKKALFITIFEIIFAIFIGGIVFRLLV